MHVCSREVLTNDPVQESLSFLSSLRPAVWSIIASPYFHVRIFSDLIGIYNFVLKYIRVTPLGTHYKWGSPIPFPTGGACVLSVIRFQDGGRRSAGAGLFNDLITAILDIFRKSNIYGPKGKKIRITKIWGLQIYIDDITLYRNDLSLHLYKLYIRLLSC